MDQTLLKTLTTFTIGLLIAYLLFTILAPFLSVLVWAGAFGVIYLREKAINTATTC